jgi:hypothetical protein
MGKQQDCDKQRIESNSPIELLEAAKQLKKFFDEQNIHFDEDIIRVLDAYMIVNHSLHVKTFPMY